MERQLNPGEPICMGDRIKVCYNPTSNDNTITYAFREEPEPEPAPEPEPEPAPEPDHGLNFGQAMAAVWEGKTVARDLDYGCTRYLVLGLTRELLERNSSHWDGGRWYTVVLNRDDTGCSSWRIVVTEANPV